MRRIDPRPRRVGTRGLSDPESLEVLAERREQHERLTRDAPERPFRALLEERMRATGDAPEPAPPPVPPPGAIEPHLGLDPRQSPTLAASRGHRSAKVILKA